jgi:signal transduction histidine kinase
VYLLEFKVIDTGIGIKEEDLDKLFKLFSKLTSKNGINDNGVGLGLTICKKLSQLLGGGIKVESKLG